MISYDPLWKLLIDKKLKKLELCKAADISTATLAKMGKNEYVALPILEKICLALDCPIESVIEIKGRGSIGTPIPSMEDLAKTDGDKLKDAAGREWDAGLVKINDALGGGYELCHVEEKRARKKKGPDE